MTSEITLLETVGVRQGVAPLWPLHLERLRKSANVLALPLPAEIPRPGGGGDHIVRYAVGGGRVYVSGRALELLDAVELVTSKVVHVGYPHKTDHRNWLDDARAIAMHAEAHDALLLNHAGLVVEASNWAIGWWEEQGLVFPPLTLAGLASVARRRLGELTAIREVRRSREELRGKSMLVCNAARGVVRVSRLDDEVVPEDSRTAELVARFWERSVA